MAEREYQFAYYRPEHESQVVDLLAGLWKSDLETRTRLFRWKYLENPGADQPLGIVALDGGQVAGFRGYFANRYVIDGHDDHVCILHPGDTIVDPAHQNQGLSVAMGNLALQYDATRYRLFMSMSCSRQSLPGYLKLGFQPLTPRIRLIRPGSSPLRWLTNRKAEIYWPRVASPVRSGRFGDILVTEAPRPADMAAIIADQGSAQGALTLLQDEAFFAWRYRNPAARYVFYFQMDGDRARGFIAVGIAPNNLTGEIVDYGDRDGRAMGAMLNFIDEGRHFAVLSIFRYGADERLRKVLTDLGFSTAYPLQRLVAKTPAEPSALPLLIRPIRKSYADSDFMVHGVDMRRPESWRLKPICSDGA